jgi:hypothetical protein
MEDRIEITAGRLAILFRIREVGSILGRIPAVTANHLSLQVDI